MQDEQRGAPPAAHVPRAVTIYRSRWLVIAKAGWLALALFLVVLLIVSSPLYYHYQQTECLNTSCFDRASISETGLSPTAYATLYTAFELMIALVVVSIAALLFWRGRDDSVALLAAYVLLLWGTVGAPRISWALAEIYPPWQSIVNSFRSGTLILFTLFLYRFPDGRITPRWISWFGIPLMLLVGIGTLFPNTAVDIVTWPFALEILVLIAWMGSMLGVQIYRYRYVSNSVQRQQTKWVVFGNAGLALIFIGAALLRVIFPWRAGQEVILYIAVQTAFVLLPVSIGIAVLRYRLWDIDPILNRTMVYGILTALLLLIYVGSVMILQMGFHKLTGQESESATILSTLGVALLAAPLRRRIQYTIDRRFYRRKYDARKTLEAFSATVRDEVALEALTERLLVTVEETMQPEHLSIRLRKPELETQQVTAPLSTISGAMRLRQEGNGSR